MGTTTFTVTKSPSAVTTTGTWTTPENVYTDNGSYASTTGTLNTEVTLITSGYGFSIPSYATIVSVIARMQWYSSSGTDTAEAYLRVYYDGTTRGGAVITNCPSTLTTVTLPTDYVTGVTVSELNSENLQGVIGLKKLSGTETYYFDYIEITVEYTVPSETSLVNGYTLIDTGWVNPGNVYASDNTAMTWTSPASSATQELWLNIPNMGIPASATIHSAHATVRVKHNLASQGRTYHTDLYYNSTSIQAEEKSITASATMYTNYDMDDYASLPTVAQCNSGNLRIKFKIEQTVATSLIYSVDSVNLTVIYSVPPVGNVYVNIGGTWKIGVVYVNIGGTWKVADSVKVNIGGVWK